MPTFSLNVLELAKFVAAYNAGESMESLADRIGYNEATTSVFARGLVRLSVMPKRKNYMSAESRAKYVENIRRARATAAAERAEFRQWKASRGAAQPLAAE